MAGGFKFALVRTGEAQGSYPKPLPRPIPKVCLLDIFYICSFRNNGFSFPRWLSPAGLDLAEHLLTFNPALRATAVQALDASYFKQEQPPPELPTGYVYLITPAIIIFLTDLLCLYSLATLEGEWHELETKRERAKKRRRTEAPAPSGTQ